MTSRLQDCIGIRYWDAPTLRAILDRAKRIQSGVETPNLSQKMIATVFFEPSTRTRISFEAAIRNCGASPITVDVNHCSLTKGETLMDMMMNIAAMGIHGIVIRHSQGGIPHFVAQWLSIPVINAGDGYHEHPTQGLLDVATLEASLGDLSGKHILLLGDIAHSRVAKSAIWALRLLGARVSVCGPPNLVPPVLATLGVDMHSDLDAVLPTVDAVNVLRIQFERQQAISVPSVAAYNQQYGMTYARQAMMPDHAIILHPGPINRDVELDSRVADGHKNAILKQVRTGVFVRMAVLAELLEAHA
jgi:aspartate carbamoyltransferase catalytic subunit